MEQTKMNDLIELSDAELALVTGGGHGSSPVMRGGHGSGPDLARGHNAGFGQNVGLGLARSLGIVQTNNSIIIQISVAFNINSPGATAIAGNGVTSSQGNLAG